MDAWNDSESESERDGVEHKEKDSKTARRRERE